MSCGCQNRHKCSYHEGYDEGYWQAEKDIAAWLGSLSRGFMLMRIDADETDSAGFKKTSEDLKRLKELVEAGKHRSRK